MAKERSTPAKPARAAKGELPVELFESQRAWETYLKKHHKTSPGLWLRIAKKGSGIDSVTYDEAIEIALCYGWIDGQKKSHDASTWLQKFTPRGAKSIWSKINREKALALIESGRMKPAGTEAIERAKQNGQWDGAYDSQSKASIPDDLQAALDKHPRAAAFFATLNSANRYAILFRIQTAKKAETRERRIQTFIEMLERHEKLHP